MRIEPDDLIDAGLTPRTASVETFRDGVQTFAGRSSIDPVIHYHQPFLEAPYERAAHALLDAVGETALAILTAPTREDVLEFKDALDKAIVTLQSQSLAAQDMADKWGKK